MMLTIILQSGRKYTYVIRGDTPAQKYANANEKVNEVVNNLGEAALLDADIFITVKSKANENTSLDA